MDSEMRKRVFLYYSGIFKPVYELYRLNQNPIYAVQRFCPLEFSENIILRLKSKIMIWLSAGFSKM